MNSGDKNNSAAAYSLKRCSDKEAATSVDQILWDRWNILRMENILRPRIIQLAMQVWSHTGGRGLMRLATQCSKWKVKAIRGGSKAYTRTGGHANFWALKGTPSWTKAKYQINTLTLKTLMDRPYESTSYPGGWVQ